MPAAPSKEFLTSKAGPLPVYAWGGIGLAAAYAYSKYKANKTASQGNGTTGTTNAAGESTAAAPQFIIENQEASDTLSVNNPITVNNPAPVPVTTPPGTTPTPPTTPVLHPGPGPVRGPFPVVGPSRPAPPNPPPSRGRPAPHYQVYRVQHGDNLSKIAAKYHTTWQALWSFNTGPDSPRSAEDKATLIRRGKGLLYAGEEIYIPT